MASYMDGVDRQLILSLVSTLLPQLRCMQNQGYLERINIPPLLRQLEELLKIAGSMKETE